MITMVGSGKVGGDAAMFCALKKLDTDILLLDITKGLPQGEAMDINHMLSEYGIDCNVQGSNNYEDMKGSDVVVIVAGSGRKPGMTRMDLLKINAGIIKDITNNIKKYADNSIIIPVTNPLDPITYIAYKTSGFDKSKVFGMGGMLDLSRFKQFIHEATNHSRSVIEALVIGEHGENMLPLIRFATVAGIPLQDFIADDKQKQMIQDTKNVAAKIIELKGATVHAPGNAISAMIESIIHDKKRIIPVSTYLNGEYGHSDVCIGVPAVIGRKGIEKIITLNLNEEEKVVMNAAAENVKKSLSSIDL